MKSSGWFVVQSERIHFFDRGEESSRCGAVVVADYAIRCPNEAPIRPKACRRCLGLVAKDRVEALILGTLGPNALDYCDRRDTR